MSTSPEVRVRLSLDGAQQVQQGATGAAAGFEKLETVLDRVADSTGLSAQSLQALAGAQGSVAAQTKQAGAAVAQSAEQALKLEKSSAAAAVAQAQLATATTRAAAAQEAYAKAAANAGTSQKDLTALQQRATSAAASQAQAAIRAREAASAFGTLQAAQAAAGAQSKLTGNQVAQLSNQLQDLFIQIQAGGSPLTALLQQGSQLSAVFGGVGGALKAVGSLISPVVVLFGTAAAAITALLLAYNQGAAENDAFVRSIVLSGNAAGVTTGQLRDMARAQAEVVGTQGKAAEVLARLVATGNVAAAAIGKVGEATTRLEREGVASLDKIVDKFDALGKAPLTTLVKLNEAENFLTKSLYDQVKALEKRGQLAEAARVAQEAYADISITRSKQLEEQLGTIERGWRAITESAKEAWDTMLGLGRKQTPLEQLKQLQKDLEANERRTDEADSYDPASGRRRTGKAARRQEIQDQIRDLQAAIYWTKAHAASQAVAAQATKGYVASQDELDRALKRAVEEQKRQIEAGKKLAESMALTDAGFSADFLDEWKKLHEAYKAGALSADAYAQAHDRLIQKQLQQHPVLEALAKAAQNTASAIQAARNAEASGIDEYLRRQKDAGIAAVESARDRRNALRDEESAAALAKSTNISLARAIELVGIARQEERLQNLDAESPAARALKEEIALRREVLALMGKKEVREATAQAAEDSARAWEQTASTITSLITNAIQMGGKAGWEYVEDYIKANAIQAIVQMGVNSVGNWLGIAGAAAGAAGGGGGNNWLSLMGMAGQAGGGWGSIASTAAGWFGVGGSTAAGGTAAATGSAAAGGAASAIPIIGWIIAAIMASKGAYESGNTLDMLRDAKADWGAGKFEADKYDTLTSLGMSDKWAQILSGAPLTARLFGHKASVSGYGFGAIANGDFQQGTLPMQFGRNVLGGGVDPFMQDLASGIAASVGLSASIFGGGLTNGLRVGTMTDRDRENEVASLLGFFGADNKLMSGVQTGSGAFGAGGPGTAASKINAEDLEKWIGEQMPVLIIQGLQQSDLTDRFDTYFDSVGAAKLTPELATTMLQTATAVQQLTDAFLPLGGVFSQLDDLSVANFEKLAKAAGGFDALGQGIGSYYQAFYDEAERTEDAWAGITKVLREAGVETVPTTKDGFRALVDSLGDLATEADQKTFTALMKVAGAFAQLTDSADAAAEATAREAAAAAKKREDEAQGRLTTLEAAIAQQLPKFLNPEQQRTFQFQQIQTDLQRGGVSLSIDQLMGASKEQILAFAAAFVDLKDGASVAEIAVVNAAGALADMADDAAAVAQEKREKDAARAAEAKSVQDSLNASFNNLVNGLKQGVVGAYNDVAQIIASERQRLESEAEKSTRVLEQQADAITRTYGDLIGSLGDAAQQLSADLAGDGGRGAALGTLQQALGDLRSGRDVDTDAVRAAAGTAGRLDPSGFASAFEYRKAQASTASLLREVAGAARQQQTTALGAIAAQQVKVEAELQKQLTALDDQLKEARSAAGSLVSIDSGVQTVAGAIGQLAVAMNAVKAAEGKGGAPTGQWLASGGNEVWAADGGAVAARPQGASLDGTIIKGLKTSFTAADAVAFVQDRLTAGDITGIYWRAVAEGIDSKALDALMNWKPGTSLAEALRLGLPAFATGSPYIPNTGLAIVHQGERIIPAAENAVLMRLISEGSGGGAGYAVVVAELRAQLAAAREMHEELMDALDAVSDSTSRTARSADDIATGQVIVRTREVTA